MLVYIGIAEVVLEYQAAILFLLKAEYTLLIIGFEPSGIPNYPLHTNGAIRFLFLRRVPVIVNVCVWGGGSFLIHV